MKILFICDGNICRSPAAAVLMSSLANETIAVLSAGIYASEGRPMVSLMRQVLTEYGLACDHLSQKISSENLMWADLFFTMTRPQKFLLISMAPAVADKVFTLREYVGYPAQDIAVPRGETMEAYRDCAELIKCSCRSLYKEIRENRL